MCSDLGVLVIILTAVFCASCSFFRLEVGKFIRSEFAQSRRQDTRLCTNCFVAQVVRCRLTLLIFLRWQFNERALFVMCNFIVSSESIVAPILRAEGEGMILSSPTSKVTLFNFSRSFFVAISSTSVLLVFSFSILCAIHELTEEIVLSILPMALALAEYSKTT